MVPEGPLSGTISTHANAKGRSYTGPYMEGIPERALAGRGKAVKRAGKANHL